MLGLELLLPVGLFRGDRFESARQQLTVHGADTRDLVGVFDRALIPERFDRLDERQRATDCNIFEFRHIYALPAVGHEPPLTARNISRVLRACVPCAAKATAARIDTSLSAFMHNRQSAHETLSFV